MPATLRNTTTTDNYRDTTLGGDRGYVYGQLTIANNPVSIIVQHGQRGTFTTTEYEYVTPTQIPLVASQHDQIIGVQIKSAITGSAAQVSGWLLEPDVAGLGGGTAYGQTVSASGQVTNPVAASAAARIHGNAQSVNSGANTTITFAGTDYDTNGIVDLVAHPTRLTCQTAGVYATLGQIDWAAAAAGIRQAFLRLNGAKVISSNIIPSAGAASDTMQETGTHYQLAAGDYLELVVVQTSGGPINVNGDDLVNNQFSPILQMAKQP